MGYGAADDIVLRGPDFQNQKKKGKSGKIILILFILIIILGGAAAGYWYYINYIQETPKATFFKYVGQNNFENVLDVDVYYNMLDQMSKKSFSSSFTSDITTNMKSDLTENIDVSKFDIALNVVANRTTNKSLLDANITYSSNDLLNFKLLSTNEEIGIGSEDVFDKYIASSKDELNNSLRKTTGIESDVSADELDNMLLKASNNSIKLENEYKEQKSVEYFNSIYNLVPEEAVTKKENVVVTLGSEAINTNAYTLTLEKNNYQEILRTVLEKLKNDDELLNKIVTGKEKNEEEATEEKPATPINTITNIQTQTEYIEGQSNTHETELTAGNEENMELEITSIPETDLVDQTSLDTTSIPEIELDYTSNQKEESSLYKDLAIALILGQKIDGTAQDLKEKIDDELSRISSINEGIIITVYVRNEDDKDKENVKLIAELPNKTSIDVEYIGSTKFKVTYLEPKNNDQGKEISSGSSIEIEKKSSDVNVKYYIQYNKIENEKIVSKTQIELETNNANSSKGYTNNAIIKYNNNDGDFKINIKNEIKFQESEITEELTSENSIFLNELSDEEAQDLYIQLFEKIMTVYEEKIENLNFIENNSSNSVIKQPEIGQANNEEKQEIKSKLIETVSNMMGEAEQRGESFTIQNLAGLSIEGYNVSCSVSVDLAIIKINGYTFNIDKDFMLTEQ